MEQIDYETWLKNRYGRSDTIRQYLRCQGHFQRLYPEITQENIEKYVSKHGHAVSRAFLKSYLSYLGRTDLSVPHVKSRPHQKIHKFLTKEQVDKLINGLTPKMSLMVRLYFETGLRLNELLRLRRKDIDTLKGVVRGTGKGNKDFEEPFSLTTNFLLCEFIDGMEYDEYVFHWKNVLHQDKKFWYRLRRDAEKLGIPDCHPHRLRHALGYYLRKDKGWDMPQIKTKLRHAKLETTNIYAGATKEEVDTKMKEEVFEKPKPQGDSCPKCKGEIIWKQLGQGGDGLLFCKDENCGWVEDPTKPMEE